MPKRLTLEEIKETLLAMDTEHKCSLLSTKYVNSTTPLKFRCNLCGSIFYRDYAHLRRGRFTCPNCSAKKTVSKLSYNIQDVKDFLALNDINGECELLSTEYKNNHTPLLFRCRVCGENFERDFSHIKLGRFRCPTCGRVAGAKKLEYTLDDVDELLSYRNYIRIGPYVNAGTPFLVECQHQHQFSLILSHYLTGHSGCKKCANEAMKGEGHPNWKGGESEVIDHFRKILFAWKRQVLIRDGFNCVLSQRHDNLVVHHLLSFNSIIAAASEQTSLPILRRIKDYSQEDLTRLEEAVLNLHPLSNGITLTREIHNSFHQQYGKGNNTVEQFIEFCSKNNFPIPSIIIQNSDKSHNHY